MGTKDKQVTGMTQFAEEEEANFMQLSETRQLAPEHNKTIGGNRVSWQQQT